MGGYFDEIKIAIKSLNSINSTLTRIAKALEERNNADPDVKAYRALKKQNYISEGDE